jgi:hypothetical protein
MWSLPMPAHKARDTYLLCISRITRERVRQAMLQYADAVAVAADLYAEEARAANLHTLNSAEFTPSVPQDRTEMIKVYTNRMAKEDARGRPVYNALKLAAGRCPLCGHRDVSTLDHYLPKRPFPVSALRPRT